MNNSTKREKFNRDSNNSISSKSFTEKKPSFKLNDVKPILIIDEINKNESYYQKFAFRNKNSIESTSEISDILKTGFKNPSPKNKDQMEDDIEIFTGDTNTNKISSKLIKINNRSSSKGLGENSNTYMENTSRSSKDIFSKKDIFETHNLNINNEYVPNEQKISDKKLNLKRKHSEKASIKENEKFVDKQNNDYTLKNYGNLADQTIFNHNILKNDGNILQKNDINDIENLTETKTSDKTEDIKNFNKINIEIITQNETNVFNNQSSESPKLSVRDSENNLVKCDSIQSFENVYITDKNNSNRVSFEQINEIKKNFTDEVTLKKYEKFHTGIFEKNEVIINNDEEELEKIKILEEKRKKLYTRLGYDVVDSEAPLSKTNRLWNRKSEFDVFQNVNVKKLAKILEKRFFGIEPLQENEDNNVDLIKDEIPKVPEISETNEFINLKSNKGKRKATQKRFSFI